MVQPQCLTLRKRRDYSMFGRLDNLLLGGVDARPIFRSDGDEDEIARFLARLEPDEKRLRESPEIRADSRYMDEKAGGAVGNRAATRRRAPTNLPARSLNFAVGARVGQRRD